MLTAFRLARCKDNKIVAIGPDEKPIFVDKADSDTLHEAILIVNSFSADPIKCTIVGGNGRFMASEPSGKQIFNRIKAEGWEYFNLEVSMPGAVVTLDPQVIESIEFKLIDMHSNYLFEGDSFRFNFGGGLFEILSRVYPNIYNPATLLQSKGKASELISHKQNRFLEIGSGSKPGRNGWITLDSASGCDIQWDLRFGIPFPSDSFDIIYASHVLEHIPFPDLKILLSEVKRTLSPGGKISICVPSARKYIDAYNSGISIVNFTTGYGPGICDTGSLIDQLNYTAYMGGEHKYMFDSQSLVNLLLVCGFNEVTPRVFDPSIDMEVRDWESIYAEGFKPFQ